VQTAPNTPPSADQARTEAATKFLTAVWGADANGALTHVHLVALKLKPKGFKHYAFYKVKDAVDYALDLSANGHDVYFACATFAAFNATNKGNRAAANALRAHSFWLDVDAGPGKPYADQAAGAEALKAFCKAVGLPKPSLIVNSGHGLHCYWHFAQFINAKEWVAHAEQLKDLARAKGFHPDPQRTADLASVLRPPGMMNWKELDNPKPVELLHASAALDLASFVAALNANARSSSVVRDTERLPAPSSSTTDSAREYPPSSAHEIVKHCPTLAHVAAVRGAVSEPLWRLMLGAIKYTTEGEALCHEWSKGDPRYDAAETQEKLDRWTKPPTLCASFRELPDAHCAGCTQLCKSPIQLGAASQPTTEGENASHAELGPRDRATLDAIFATLNRDHFVAKVGGSTFVFNGQDQPLLETGMSFTSFAQFIAPRIGYKVARKWLQHHPDRRTYDRLVFDPSGNNPDNTYNTWRGLAVTPCKGEYQLIAEHILNVWCGGDIDQFHYVIRWMALSVQKPWIKPEVALVLRSDEGAGKNIIVSILLKIFGKHAFITSQKEQVAGKFNGHLFDKILVVFNEAFFAGDPAAVAAAKALVTDDEIGYESKGKAAFTALNYAHVIILSNHDWVVPAGSDARRWMVLDISEARKGDHTYFESLAAEIENGGVEAFLYALLRVDLSSFNPRRLPTSKALAMQRALTMERADPAGNFLLQALAAGEFHSRLMTTPWQKEITVAELQSAYEETTARARGGVPPFARAIKRMRQLLPSLS
jgi:hypothetical protein